jgi:hypothetical protein
MLALPLSAAACPMGGALAERFRTAHRRAKSRSTVDAIDCAMQSSWY